MTDVGDMATGLDGGGGLFVTSSGDGGPHEDSVPDSSFDGGISPADATAPDGGLSSPSPKPDATISDAGALDAGAALDSSTVSHPTRTRPVRRTTSPFRWRATVATSTQTSGTGFRCARCTTQD